jgi:nitroreductase
MNQALEMILSRRSVRAFTGADIPEEDLDAILRAGMAAPSGMNIRPWVFVVVQDRARLLRLRDRLPYAKMLDKAGAAVVVCGLPDKDGVFARDFWVQDCSAATENILLAAHALGYGAVWTAVYPVPERIAVVAEECGLPERAIPLNVIPIGVPAKAATRSDDRFDPESIRWERWTR